MITTGYYQFMVITGIFRYCFVFLHNACFVTMIFHFETRSTKVNGVGYKGVSKGMVVVWMGWGGGL